MVRYKGGTPRDKRKIYARELQNEDNRKQVVDEIGSTYKFVERREATVKNVDDLKTLLGGVYSAKLLSLSRSSEPEIGDLEDTGKPEGTLKLPDDGSIFHDGIPFHHYTLGHVKPKHVRRLKKNGVDLKAGMHFTAEEDKQIEENWKSFAAAHDIPEVEVTRYVGAACVAETRQEYWERTRFIRESLFRPWMCQRLLNRTCAQVFRRCYHKYHVSETEHCGTRKWTPEEDDQLLELVRSRGHCWEFIGNELMRHRYACFRRFQQLTGAKSNDPDEEGEGEQEKDGARTNGQPQQESERPEWQRVEIARLYEYLADHLPRNPLVVAIVPKSERHEAHIDWADPKMRLPDRSAEERRQKWVELKAQFVAAKEQLGVEHPRALLRAVIPEDTRITARARIEREPREKQQRMSTEEYSRCLTLMHDYCAENQLDRLRDVDAKELKGRLKAQDLLKRRMRPFMRQVKFLLFIGERVHLFKMLPIEEDTFRVHLRLLAFIFAHIKSLQVKKRTLRKYTRRFIHLEGWEQRKQIVLVDRSKPKKLAFVDDNTVVKLSRK